VVLGERGTEWERQRERAKERETDVVRKRCREKRGREWGSERDGEWRDRGEGERAREDERFKKGRKVDGGTASKQHLNLLLLTPGVNPIKLFLIFFQRQNKLECLSLAGLRSLV